MTKTDKALELAKLQKINSDAYQILTLACKTDSKALIAQAQIYFAETEKAYNDALYTA